MSDGDQDTNGTTSAASSGNGTDATQPSSVQVPSPVAPGGLNIPVITFASGTGANALGPTAAPPATSPLSGKPAYREAEIVELAGDKGMFIFYPRTVPVQIGDVFYFRERSQPGMPQTEDGIIVQVIEVSQVNYAQVDEKTLWRALTAVRASELKRNYNEPKDTVDIFEAATFMVRNAIVSGRWQPPGGRIVTRNSDIFEIDPANLGANVLTSTPKTDLDIGAYKSLPVRFGGQALDKVTLSTGMKGSGKSHLTKGIVDQSRQQGMSTVVFDINDEYGELPGVFSGKAFRPGETGKFRLDRTDINTFMAVFNALGKTGEKTEYKVRSNLNMIWQQRKTNGKPFDIAFLIEKAEDIFPKSTNKRGEEKDSYVDNMRGSYISALMALDNYHLFLTEAECKAEDDFIAQGRTAPMPPKSTKSLRAALYTIEERGTVGVIVFSIGGLLREVQEAVVRLVKDELKELCDRQAAKAKADPKHVPVYPSVVFEEAHMYMEDAFINDLIPVVRHMGMNLFFVTNTPGALPDSVFRLLDNLFMTRMVNGADIAKVASCGLVDKETIESFAPNMPDRCALVASSVSGVTKGFPLVFNVRDFGLKKSGATRSMWAGLLAKAAAAGQESADDQPSAPEPEAPAS